MSNSKKHHVYPDGNFLLNFVTISARVGRLCSSHYYSVDLAPSPIFRPATIPEFHNNFKNSVCTLVQFGSIG